MATRLMVNVDGKPRPLCLDPQGHTEPLLSSASTGWAGLPFEIHRMGPMQDVGSTGPIEGERGLLVILDGQVECVLRENGREHTYVATPGTVSLVSGDRRRDLAKVSGSATVLALHVPREWFRRVARSDAPDDFVLAQPWIRDETIYNLARAMWQEVARNASTGQVFAESLSMALLSYLTSQLPSSDQHRRGRLSDAQERIVADYIIEQLHTELSVMGLASLVGLGPRRFSTLFRQTFGTTPHRYIVERRLNEGARLLENGHDIAEVARRVGFCSQSHFTAAFRESYGITPRRYVRHPRMAQTG